MKKTILSLLTLVSVSLYAQSTIVLTNVSNSQTLAPNAIIDLTTSPSTLKKNTLDIKNNGSTTASYNVIRYDVTLNSGALAYYCFAGTCYGPSTIISASSITLTAGQSASDLSGQYNMLEADLDEGASVGVSLIKYTFINTANTSDSVQVSLRYNDAPTVNIKEINASLNSLQISPNPANDLTNIKINSNNNYTGKLSVYNSIGSLVSFKDVLVTKGANNVALNTNTLNAGIYFVSFKSGESTVTKKLIIK